MKKCILLLITMALLIGLTVQLSAIYLIQDYDAYYDDYEEYSAFIKSDDCDETFISYDEINELGAFKSITLIKFNKNYTYNLIDKTNTEISINVSHYSEEEPALLSNESTTTVDLSDMRNNNTKSKGVFLISNIEYSYNNKGKLVYISVIDDNGIKYNISGLWIGYAKDESTTVITATPGLPETGNWLGDYTEDADTLIGKLLDLEKNPEAPNELLSLLNAASKVTTVATTTNATTTVNTTTLNTSTDNGCGSVISVTASATAALVVACGAVIVRKRNKHNI